MTRQRQDITTRNITSKCSASKVCFYLLSASSAPRESVRASFETAFNCGFMSRVTCQNPVESMQAKWADTGNCREKERLHFISQTDDDKEKPEARNPGWHGDWQLDPRP